MIEYQTLSEMTAEVGRFIGDTGTTNATKIKDTLNKWYSYVSKQWVWPTLIILDESNITTTSGEKRLYLPKRIDRVYFIYTPDLENSAVFRVADQFFEREGTLAGNQGAFTTFADAGELGRKADFSSTAEILSVSSSSSSDTTQTVVLRGLVSGEEAFEEVTLSGTTPVDSTNTYQDLFSASCDGSNAGVVSVAGKTSGTTYAALAPRERTARYRVLRLSSIPDSTDTLKVFARKRINRLSYDNDVPEIPVSQYLVEKAISEHFARQRKWAEAASYHMQISEAILRGLTRDLSHEPAIIQATPTMRHLLRKDQRQVIVVSNG